ncbi:MAG: response regulator [Bacteroidota bacterium]|nr:response regulator [Bacteroidota bacterium]
MSQNPIDYLCVIDDDEIYQFTLLKTIEASKLVRKTISFYNGELAINFLNEQIKNQVENGEFPDVIFLDLNMPVMDGWEFLELYVQIRPNIGKKVLVYVVSSSNIEYEIKKAKSISDVSDYIVKPITREHLITIAEELAKNMN